MRAMPALVQAFLIGLLFGFGLLLSGMGNPQKVLGFLDLAGHWDPALALVMVGAIGVGLPVFRLAEKRSAAHVHSWSGTALCLPDKTALTPRLIIGSVLFGTGWGLAGVCPGPALVLLGVGQMDAGIFVAAMLAGMLAYRPLDQVFS